MGSRKLVLSNPSSVWDWLKFKIKVCTIHYSKQNSRKRKDKIGDLEKRIHILETLLATSPTPDIVNQLDKAKQDLHQEYDYDTQ